MFMKHLTMVVVNSRLQRKGVRMIKNRTKKEIEIVSLSKSTYKVLFVATVYTHLAAFCLPFMKLLQEKSCEVHVAASSKEGRREEVETVRVICGEVLSARSPYSPANVRAYYWLKALLKKHHFDLIHVHTPMAAFVARSLAKATNQGTILYTTHGF